MTQEAAAREKCDGKTIRPAGRTQIRSEKVLHKDQALCPSPCLAVLETAPLCTCGGADASFPDRRLRTAQGASGPQLEMAADAGVAVAQPQPRVLHPRPGVALHSHTDIIFAHTQARCVGVRSHAPQLGVAGGPVRRRDGDDFNFK